MDQINLLKGRMAEALVEGIFKRARYTVARVGRETQVPGLLRTGRTEFMPDFVVWRELDAPSLGHHSYRLLAIEVKYRADLADYLRRESPSRTAAVAQQWPELYELIVTDRPEPGRSCFQAIHVSAGLEGTPRSRSTSTWCPASTSIAGRWRSTKGSCGRSSRSSGRRGTAMRSGRESRPRGWRVGWRRAITGGPPGIPSAIARRPPTSSGRARASSGAPTSR